MKLTINCPHGQYGAGMVIYCTKDHQPCAHQYFKACKGWYVLSPGAEDCPGRKENHDGKSSKTTANYRNAVRDKR